LGAAQQRKHENRSCVLAVLGLAVCHLCRTHGNFRQGRSRERQFRLCDLRSHDCHPAGTRGNSRASGQWQSPASISGRSYLFLILSGLATGASWICYFRALKLGDAARVAPIDKLSVVLVVVFGAVFLSEKLSAAD
jgi:hypothetical protein